MKRPEKNVFRTKVLACLLSTVMILGNGSLTLFAREDTQTEETLETQISSEEYDQTVLVEESRGEDTQVEEAAVKAEEAQTREEAASNETDGQAEASEDVDEEPQAEETVDTQAVAQEAYVTVDSVDSESGAFQIHVGNLSEVADGDSVRVPVWSQKDQSDIVWYTASKTADGWYVNSNLSKHKYNIGHYTVHAYLQKAETGTLELIKGTDFDVAPTYASLEAVCESQDANGTVQITLDGFEKYGLVSSIRFAVWSSVNGQDDLKWYTASEIEKGSFSKTIKLSDHSGTGIYQVHCYALNPNGTLRFVGATTFEVEAATLEQISVSDISPDGSFTVTISGLNAPSGVKTVYVPIWSKSDQSDIVWYTAQKSGDTYVVKGNISKHGYHTGTYQVHVYVSNLRGNLEFVGSVKKSVSYSYSNFQITDVDGNERKFEIQLEGLSTFGSSPTVYFVVWSEADGQDDIKWYTAKGSYGVYDYTVKVADHKSAGKYAVHCYVRGKDGTLTFLCNSSFEVSGASAQEMEFTTQKDTGSMTLSVGNITSASGIRSVSAKIWSKDDKSDQKEYSLAEDEGTYSLVTNIRNFDWHTGTYTAQVSAVDENGITSELGTLQADMNLEGGTIFVDSSISELYYPLTLSGFEFCNADSSLQFAIWSEEGGQDDLVWYGATKANGVYKANFNMVKHMTAGKYYVHVYVLLKDGTRKLCTATEFTVDKLPAERVEITNQDSSSGTFTVKVTLTREQSAVSSVFVPVWSEQDQSDMVWYTAERQADGTYTAVVDVAKHAYHFGTYNVHVYVQDSAGALSFVTNTIAEAKPVNYVVANQISDCLMQITIYGPSINGQTVSAVYFPTWSVASKQTDIIWYAGEENADGSYTVSIYRRNHSYDGDYETDIYLSDGSSTTLLRGVAYSMSEPTGYDSYAAGVMRNILFAVETGGQVYGNARYDCFSTAYKSNENEHAITIGAGQWYGTSAKKLLNLIRERDPETFAQLDTAGIGDDLDNADWSTYGTDGTICSDKEEGRKHITIDADSAKAKAIQAILSSDAGIAVQNELMESSAQTFVDQAAALGVSDLKARMFCANLCHLGGYSAMKRVVKNCISDGLSLTVDNLWTVMLKYDDQSDGGNQVGSPMYHSRHIKVMNWLNSYIG